jgi:DNA-binding NarL/FixJ family response regulator
MSGATQPTTVLVVDPLPLRTLGLASVLERLAGSAKFRVTSLTPDEAERWMDSDAHCSMIIYNVGGVSLAEPRHARRIKALHNRAADAPLVIFSENDAREEVVAALTVGAQGFLYAGTNAQLAQQALSFIFKGGAYFPPIGTAKSHRIAQATSAGISIAPASDTNDPPHHMPADAEAASNTNGAPSATMDAGNGLTDRQKAVLERLGHGDSNKAIARHLGIREGTVKVHVRQIMRKLGATNRTQAAVAGATNGNGR